jgi:hypothetical protein
VTDVPPVTKLGTYGDVTWGDYDNDGDLDLFIANPGQSHDLYRNEGGGKFLEVIGGAGMPTWEPSDAFGVAWVDYDRDGFLDLHIVNRGGVWGDWSIGQNDCLFRNNGDGSFSKMTAERVGDIVADADPGEDCWWGDYDNDGYPDLYRFRLLPGNPYSFKTLVYHNGGTGRFARVEVGSLTAGGGGSGGWADYDNDGWLDVLGGPFSGPLALHRNLGGMTFTNVALEAGLDQQTRASSAGAWGDYDNDGDLDFLLWSFAGEKNLLYRNNGDGMFSSVEAGSPLNPLPAQRWVGPAWVDYDNDGFLDLFYGIGNGSPVPNALYRNNLGSRGNRNHWVKIGLRGTASNRSGIGTKLRLTALIGGKPVTQLREIGPGISARSGQNGLVAHFGLCDATNVARLRVEWPSGAVQEVADVSVDQTHSIVETAGVTPLNPAVSAGDQVDLSVRGSGTYQWYFNDVALIGETNRVLRLQDINVEQAGRYHVVVTTTGTTSVFATHLRVDNRFTKIVEGPVVQDLESSCGVNWVDCDNDGDLDLFVCNGAEASADELNALYRNAGDGSFVRVTAAEAGALVGAAGRWWSAAWGDLDNDGDLDCLAADMANWPSATTPTALFRNQGTGFFELDRVAAGPLVTDTPSGIPILGDYDNDGYLDVFLGVSWVDKNQPTNRLYHAIGDAGYERVSDGLVVSDRLIGTEAMAWGDYDGDGDLDLIVLDTHAWWRNHSAYPVFLYRNEGGGHLTRITEGALAKAQGALLVPAWGDYDNDCRLDLFVTDYDGPSVLFHNEGGGEFSKTIMPTGAESVQPSWGDFDNDGDLDLFVSGGQGSARTNVLFANQGGGIFARLSVGKLTSEVGRSLGCAWGDYDDNGFLDLFVSRTRGEANGLYHNNGNANHWLLLRLVGTTSNRAAIGAKIWVTTVEPGRVFRQYREISGGNRCQNDLRAHFGLGLATQARQVQIEWPSGTVQKLSNVEADQILTVVEPCRPVLAATCSSGTSVALALTGEAGAIYQLQASSNLMDWAVVGTVTNELGQGSWTDPESGSGGAKFYRAIRTGP